MALTDQFPARLKRGFELVEQLRSAGIWLAPIRHHSPACSLAGRAMIEELQPQTVLIEGPSEYDSLLNVLADAQTQPPVAVLSLLHHEGEVQASFYPLADFSPEWVALRAANGLDAKIHFIDEPWTEARGSEAVAALRGERYFAHSEALAALAIREHCRDHDELWEHLFELRPAEGGWRELFRDVFAWSALARLDYEPEVLAAEGSVRREAVMCSHILSWRQQTDGPVVAMMGAFHALAVAEALAVKLGLTSHLTEAAPTLKQMPSSPQPGAGPAWLLRYNLHQFDSLAGYGAGVKSPGFWQRRWEAGPEPIAVDCLTDVARGINDADTSERVSTAQVTDAALQAERLADLRGHAGVGRTDLLDACLSCFGQGEVFPAMRDAIGKVFGGTRLGQLPPDAPAPPILAEARDLARELRFDIADSAVRQITLDIRRSPKARRRSRFCWLMAFLDTGFARRLVGPDLIAGASTGRVQEKWEHAWSPLVEAALIERQLDGATLADAATRRLQQIEEKLAEQGASRSARRLVELMAQAALIGLDSEFERLGGRLGAVLTEDPALVSILEAARRLLGLQRAASWLEIRHPQALLELANRCIAQMIYLVGEAGAVKAKDEPEMVQALVGVHELLAHLEDPAAVELVREAFARLRSDRNTAPGVAGAVLALGVTEGETSDGELSDAVRAAFAPGADKDRSWRFLDGLMMAAPDLLVHSQELLDPIDEAITAMGPEDFLECLPFLRRAMTRLRPFETALLAERLAGPSGSLGLLTQPTLSEWDLAEGVAAQRALAASLAADGLEAWVDLSAVEAGHANG